MTRRIPPGFVAPSVLQTFHVDGVDRIRRSGILITPGERDGTFPVLLTPHPFGFDPLINLFGHQLRERTVTNLPGIWEVALSRGFAVLSVQAEGRRYTGASLGWRPHLDAYSAILAQAAAGGCPIREDTLFAAGLSMGGMEALLLGAVMGPSVRAIAVQNAIIDLSGWRRHIAKVAGFEKVAGVIREEVGGVGCEREQRLHERSPLSYLGRLRETPIHARYSLQDSIVPADTQSLLLAEQSPNWELIEEATSPSGTAELGRRAHEHVRWEALLDFLLAASDRPARPQTRVEPTKLRGIE